MKKLLLMFVSLFVLVGCMDNLAADSVKNYLNQYRNLSDNVVADLGSLTDEQELTEEQKLSYLDVMKKQYKDLHYEIVEEKYDGNKAKVTAKITVYDLYKVQENAKKYMNNHKEEFYNEDNLYDNELYLNYKLKEMKNNTETITYTVTFDLEKKDKEWIVLQPSEEVLEKIHGIYNYELYEE